jgi:hypothetical protein
MPARKRGVPPSLMPGNARKRTRRDITGASVHARHFESRRFTIVYSAELCSQGHPLNGAKYFGMSDREGLCEEEVMSRRRAEHERQARFQAELSKGVHKLLFEGHHFVWKVEATCPDGVDCPSEWASKEEREAIRSHGGPYRGETGPVTTLNLTVGGEGTYADKGARTAVAFDRYVSHLRLFIRAHGHARVRQVFKCADGYPLGAATNRIRLGQLVGGCPERRALLDSMGFVWSHSEMTWRKCQEALERYKEKEKHLDVPQDYVDTECPGDPTYRLGLVVYRIRRGTFGHHDPERISWLEERGFKMNMHTFALDTFLAHLREFAALRGTTRVPQKEKSPSDATYALGMGASDYKKKYWRGTLEADKVRRLNEAGFDWGKARRRDAQPATAGEEGD